MSTGPRVSVITIATAGVAVPFDLVANQNLITSVYVEADEDNVGDIFVGDPSVTTSVYSSKLPPKSVWSMSVDINYNGGDAMYGSQFNMGAFAIIGANVGDKVHVTGTPYIGSY